MTVQPKYRPSLSLPQIESIIQNLAPSAPYYGTIVRTLRNLSLKAESNMIQPAFVKVERQSTEDSLGLGTTEAESVTDREDAGQRLWELHENGITLNPSQKLTAFTYAFNNDLLTAEQESVYTIMVMSTSPTK